MKRRLWACACAFVLATAVTSAAPAEAQIEKGDKEFQLNLGFFHQQDSDTGNLSGDGAFGYYLTPSWEIGIRQGITANYVEDGPDTWIASTLPYIHYNFHDHDSVNRFVPFLGGFIGGVYNDDDFTGAIGPTLGLKIFLGEDAGDAFLLTQYRYEWFFDDLKLSTFREDFDTIKENRSDGNHVVTVGFGFLW